MLEFIHLIKQRYQNALTQLDKKSPQFFDYQQCAEQLLYAEAFIRKGQLLASMPHFPLQIAVIGPTQAGKSTIVNLLLNESLAGVSPLAGYTVHAHGFCHGLTSAECNGMQQYFGRFQCLEESMLSRQRYDCYSLANSHNVSPFLPACVCWDTPDFDSIDSADYREGVVRTIALADVIIVVVSKEKYADQSVWEMLKTIAAFQQPTLICLNKVSEDSEVPLLYSLQQKWRQHRADPVPEIVPMLFQKQGALPSWPPAADQVIIKLAKKVNHAKHALYQQQFLQKHWQHWLAPALAEHHAQQQWQALIDQCLIQAAGAYKRDYLDHPYHYATFQHALLNLLKLLEIPGMAQVLAKTRRAITWPVRKLMSLGRDLTQEQTGQEVAVLQQIGEHTLILLADRLLEKNETEAQPQIWWKESSALLRRQKAVILNAYTDAVANYHLNFEQDVEAAAQQLYYKLQEQPVVLNSLRATRATTDAAAVLLAIQAGGIGIHDLVLTPLMLSVTSLLTESALGSYMARVEADLKQQQLQTVKQLLFDQCLRSRLYQLPQQIQSAQRFNISEQQCRQAEQLLIEKKHGLRLL